MNNTIRLSPASKLCLTFQDPRHILSRFKIYYVISATHQSFQICFKAMFNCLDINQNYSLVEMNLCSNK